MGYKSRVKYMFFDKRVRSSMSRTALTEIQNVSLTWETLNNNNNNDKG